MNDSKHYHQRTWRAPYLRQVFHAGRRPSGHRRLDAIGRGMGQLLALRFCRFGVVLCEEDSKFGPEGGVASITAGSYGVSWVHFGVPRVGVGASVKEGAN